MGQLLNAGQHGSRVDIRQIKESYRELNLASPILPAEQNQVLIWSICLEILLSLEAVGCCSS